MQWTILVTIVNLDCHKNFGTINYLYKVPTIVHTSTRITDTPLSRVPRDAAPRTIESVTTYINNVYILEC